LVGLVREIDGFIHDFAFFDGKICVFWIFFTEKRRIAKFICMDGDFRLLE
jgi:hypothetical protein